MNRHLQIAFLSGLVLFFGCGPSASLVGQVNSPEGGVAGAEVAILDSSQRQIQAVTAGPEGKFGVTASLTPGVYVAEVRKNGFQTTSKTFTYPDMTSLTISMVPLLAVKGMVRLPDQSVAPQAIVRFKRSGSEEQKKVVADEGGSFQLENLDGGNYVIEVETPDGLYGIVMEYELTGQQRVTEVEVVLDPSKRSLEGVGGKIEKAKVQVGVDTPAAN